MSKVLQPDVSSLLKMSVTKRDIIELLRCNLENNLDNQVDELRAKIKKIDDEHHHRKDELKETLSTRTNVFVDFMNREMDSTWTGEVTLFDDRFASDPWHVSKVMYIVRTQTGMQYSFPVNSKERKLVTKYNTTTKKLGDKRRKLGDQLAEVVTRLQNIEAEVRKMSAKLTKSILENSDEGLKILQEVGLGKPVMKQITTTVKKTAKKTAQKKKNTKPKK